MCVTVEKGAEKSFLSKLIDPSLPGTDITSFSDSAIFYFLLT